MGTQILCTAATEPRLTRCVGYEADAKHQATTMTAAFLEDALEGVPPSLQWPIKICIYTTLTCYVLSVVSGNVSQVDRIWTFMPTIYTAYFALLPLWPKTKVLPLSPYTPDTVLSSVANNYSPRALLMLGLTVCEIPPGFRLLVKHSLAGRLDVQVRLDDTKPIESMLMYLQTVI